MCNCSRRNDHSIISMRVDPNEYEDESNRSGFDSRKGNFKRNVQANKISINMGDDENKGYGKYNFI